MPPELKLGTGNIPSGWVLVESRIGPRYGRCFSSLRVRRRSSPGEVEEIPLSIMPDGRLVEILELPDDVSELTWRTPDHGQFDASQLSVRRVGLAERVVRMAIRVVRTHLRLSRDHRREGGLTIWRSVYDLPGAYRMATAFRFRYPLLSHRDAGAFRVRYPLLNYPDWIARFDTLRDGDISAIRAHIARFAARPRFHLLLTAGTGGPEAIDRTLASLRGQLYRNFTCTVLDVAGAHDTSFNADAGLKDAGTDSRFVAQPGVAGWLASFNASLAGERAEEWVMLLHAGDNLPAHALYWFACEAQARPGAAIVYSDDDTIDAEGSRTQPRFKPDWSPTHLHSTHYVGAAAVLRGSKVAKAGGVTANCCRHGNYDLLLRVAGGAGKKIVHVPAILHHREGGSRAASAWENPQWCAAVLSAHLARSGGAAEVEQTAPGCRRVRYRLPDAPPLVSIIVPTRDAVALLRQCVYSVLERTTYPRYEILVVDNQSAAPETLAYFGKIAALPNVRVLRYDHPFNYSKINNFAAREARGEVLCLLNNDIEVISPDWLNEMTGHLLQKQAGIVGAKLFYPDSRVQHAGTVVGPGGCADHVHTSVARDEPGYCNRTGVAQEFSAVTGACLLTWKHLYERLDGLNEAELTIAFNDVDYCLRVQEAGYRVIFTPHAELVHHESATRGWDNSLFKRLRSNREVRDMRANWTQRLKHDPYYNLNLSYWRPDFSLSETPRVKKPWSQ